MTRIVTAGMGVLNPRFAALDGIGNQPKLRELFLRSLKISALLGFGICIAMILFGPKFIILWVGRDYRNAIPVLIILCCSYVFALSQNPGIILLYAINKHKYYACFTIIEGLINITLSIILVTPFGIVGVALGTMISMIIIKVFIMPVYVCKAINLGLIEYFKQFTYLLTVGFLIVLIVYISKLNNQIFHANMISYILICSGFVVLFSLLTLPIIKNELYQTAKRGL